MHILVVGCHSLTICNSHRTVLRNCWATFDENELLCCKYMSVCRKDFADDNGLCKIMCRAGLCIIICRAHYAMIPVVVIQCVTVASFRRTFAVELFFYPTEFVAKVVQKWIVNEHIYASLLCASQSGVKNVPLTPCTILITKTGFSPRFLHNFITVVWKWHSTLVYLPCFLHNHTHYFH